MARFNPWMRFFGCIVPNWLAMRTEISFGSKLIYGRLAQYAGKNGVANPSYDTLADELGCSRRQAMRLVEELSKARLLEIEPIRLQGVPRSNRYHFIEHPWMTEGGDRMSPYSDESDTTHGDKSDQEVVTNLSPEVDSRIDSDQLESTPEKEVEITEGMADPNAPFKIDLQPAFEHSGGDVEISGGDAPETLADRQGEPVTEPPSPSERAHALMVRIAKEVAPPMLPVSKNVASQVDRALAKAPSDITDDDIMDGITEALDGIRSSPRWNYILGTANSPGVVGNAMRRWNQQQEKVEKEREQKVRKVKETYTPSQIAQRKAIQESHRKGLFG